MRHLIKTTTIALIAGGAFALTTPALASPAADIVTTTIDKRDLTTEYGVERVYNALSRKAETSCERAGLVPMSIKRAEQACTRQLLEDFVFDVDNGNLTRYHVNKTS